MTIRTHLGPKSKFVIFADSFDEMVGGTLVLHTLCDRLNRLGYEAVIWPTSKPRSRNVLKWRTMGRHVLYSAYRARRFSTGPFSNAMARYSDLRDGIVIYPEIISGNPLKSSNVVRWFLHKPGYHTGEVNYGSDDLFFFFNPSFNDASINPDGDHMLSVLYVNPIYKRTNFEPRSGSCYIVRKGRGRTLDYHPQGSILVDDMTHEERASIFNRVERLYSYDMYTMYTHYAALCGCVPIIVPESGVDLEDWEATAEARYGRAYGVEQIEWAMATQGALADRINDSRANEDEQVRRFAEICLQRFKRASL